VKILVDTDVLIDLALDRKPFAGAAAQLLDGLQQRPGLAFIAWHSVSNFYYLVQAKRGQAMTRDFLLDLTRFADIAPTTTDSLIFASSLDMSDFEDALQVAAARASGATVIATRNLKDYRRSPIPAKTPADVLQDIEALDR